MKWDCILFDLDGTLWDCSAVSSKAWTEAFGMLPEKLPTPTREAIRKISGMTPEQVCDNLIPGLPRERQMEIFTFCTRYAETCKVDMRELVYPGAMEVLETLKKRFPLFLVSNCSPDYLKQCLAEVPIGRCFVEAVGYGMAGNGKTESIKNLMRRYGFSRGVYVGDTEFDYHASCKAGVDFILAAYGFGNVPQAKWKIDSITELPACIDRAQDPETEVPIS